MFNSLSLRPWGQSDCRMIYDWRMDPSVRSNSFNKREFSYSEHEQWFRKFICNPFSFGYILEKYGEPVAQIRFDKTMKDGCYNISISTAPGETGKGYGSAILELGCKDSALLKYARLFVAEVFEDNFPSRRIFEKNGFSICAQTKIDGHTVLLYRRTVNL